LTTTATVKGRDRKGYSPATKAADIKVLRAVWNWARETKLLANDPFSEVKRGGFINSERLFYVDGDTSRRVLDACPSQEWRALFALYRFGGLRAAEALILRWRDVDFKAGKITVRSPKTEHLGKGARQTPLFPQLRKELEAWKREADASPDDRVISRFSEQTNPGPLLSKILRKAGIPLWPRLIQNLRASATMDITRHCRPTDESEWLGHSALVSLQPYQRSTRDAFDAALANENLFG
jgi:integrase